MQLLEDGVIAALAATGLVALLALAVSALTRPRRRDAPDAVAVVPCRGDGAGLEDRVHTLTRSRYDCGGFRRIVILDRGMDENALRVAALLCRENYDVAICNDLSFLDEAE